LGFKNSPAFGRRAARRVRPAQCSCAASEPPGRDSVEVPVVDDERLAAAVGVQRAEGAKVGAGAALDVSGQAVSSCDTACPSQERNDSTSRSQSFNATLSRANVSDAWGVRLDSFDERLIYVAEVPAGGDSSVVRYNKSAPEERRICVGQYIVAVNSDSSKSGMMRQLNSGLHVDLEMRTPRLTSVVVPKHGAPLGLSLAFNNWAYCLYITKVEPGSVVRQALPDVAPGDRIVAVNGRHHGVQDLLEEIRLHHTPELTISRP